MDNIEDNNVSNDNDILPDITQMSKENRKELLRRLMELEQKESLPTAPDESDVSGLQLNIANNDPLDNLIPSDPVINISNISNSNSVPRYSSLSIFCWFFASIAVSCLFSLDAILCLIFQDSDKYYCESPVLHSTESWIAFFITYPLVIALIILIYYILIFNGKKDVDFIIKYVNDNQNVNIINNNNSAISINNNNSFNNNNAFLLSNKDLLNNIRTVSSWYIYWIIMTFCLSYFLNLSILIPASIRGGDVGKFAALASSQSVIYGVHFDWGVILLMLIYWALYLIFFSIFIYYKLCKILCKIAVVEGILIKNNNSNSDQLLNDNHDSLLLTFRDYLLCFRYIMGSVTLLGAGVCITATNWNIIVLFAAIFGGTQNKFYAWLIICGMLTMASSVIGILCRYRLYRAFSNIHTIITKNILPLKLECDHFDDDDDDTQPNELNIFDKLIIFWNKYEKWITNGHSVLSLLAFVIFFNFMITDDVTEPIAYIFVSFGIILVCGYLVLQLFLKDIHHRFKILYKCFLLIITIFFIIRCNYFYDKTDTLTRKHHFTLFRVIFNIFAYCGVLFIFIIIISKQLLLIFKYQIVLIQLIPGKLFNKFSKFQLLRIVFTLSTLNTLISLFWCIIYANNNSSEQLKFLYCLIWIIPVLYWQNEITQYICVYLNYNERLQGHLVSLGLIQILQPVVIIALSTSFAYLLKYAKSDLGCAPLIFCGIQLFGIMFLSIFAFWQ